MAAEPSDRYSLTSRTVHWITAGLVLANPFFAWTMEATESRAAFLAHASLGAAVLALTLFRLGWRLGHFWPPLPAGMKAWEKALARFTHTAFYPLLIVVPILGLATASAGIRGDAPIPAFGFIPLPQAPVPDSEAVHDRFAALHQLGVVALLVVLALHVAGAIKHTFFERNGVLGRMLPGVRPEAAPPAPQAAASPR